MAWLGKPWGLSPQSSSQVHTLSRRLGLGGLTPESPGPSLHFLGPENILSTRSSFFIALGGLSSSTPLRYQQLLEQMSLSSATSTQLTQYSPILSPQSPVHRPFSVQAGFPETHHPAKKVLVIKTELSHKQSIMKH